MTTYDFSMISQRFVEDGLAASHGQRSRFGAPPLLGRDKVLGRAAALVAPAPREHVKREILPEAQAARLARQIGMVYSGRRN